MSTNVTLKQIAEELGISVMTVSRAINNKANVDDKTREKVLAKAEELGYSPNNIAKSLVSSKTHTIGVVLPQITYSFFPEVVRGIEEIAYRKEYQIFLTNSDENYQREQNAIDTLRSHRVDGILISCSQSAVNSDNYRNVIKTGLPVVFFDRCVEGIGASCVKINDRESACKITRHLIDLGHKKIAHLHGPENISIGKDRLQGYVDAMEEAGYPILDDWLAESGFNRDGGEIAMKILLDLPEEHRPEAVVACTDPVAFGAIDVIRDYKLKIPQDIAIVGFSDDMKSELIDPPLTTVFQAGYEMGKKAASKLIRTIENGSEPVETIEIKTELVIRQSCGSMAVNHSRIEA